MVILNMQMQIHENYFDNNCDDNVNCMLLTIEKHSQRSMFLAILSILLYKFPGSDFMHWVCLWGLTLIQYGSGWLALDSFGFFPEWTSATILPSLAEKLSGNMCCLKLFKRLKAMVGCEKALNFGVFRNCDKKLLGLIVHRNDHDLCYTGLIVIIIARRHHL